MSDNAKNMNFIMKHLVKCEEDNTDSYINRNELLRIAKLVRISLSEDEIDHYSKELNAVLGWMKSLSNVDTDGIEPTYYGGIGQETILREDLVTDGNIRDEVLANTKSEYGYFVVPKVIESES